MSVVPALVVSSLVVPCLVVSLAHAVERRAHIRREFERAGIPFEFVDAVDGRDVTVRRVSPSFGIPLTPAEIACTLSHGRAIRRMLNRGDARAIIFEDDACLDPAFMRRIEHVLAQPLAWDILKLSGLGSPDHQRGVRSADLDIVWPTIPTLNADGYAITEAGARKLLPFLDPVHDAVDCVMQQMWLTRCVVAETVPHIVRQAGLPSTLGRDYARYNELGARWRRRTHRLRRSIWKRIGI